MEYLREAGAKKVHNVDNLLLRESMDVIGAPFLEGLVSHMESTFCLVVLRAARTLLKPLLDGLVSHMESTSFLGCFEGSQRAFSIARKKVWSQRST